MTITFAETYVGYPDGQQNVGQPPDTVMAQGFIPETAVARGQPLPAQWLNWLFQRVLRYINRDKVSDASGVGLFTIENSVLTLTAVDRDAPSNYLTAIGFKNAIDAVHVLTVVASNGLSLGTPTAEGDQPIIGGTDVVVRASSRQFGEI